jgi:hypothetical protein
MSQQERPAHHPYFLEGLAILERNDIVRDWNKLEIVRRNSDIPQNTLFLQHPSDEGGSSRHKEEGVRVFLRFGSVAFDLTYLLRLKRSRGGKKFDEPAIIFTHFIRGRQRYTIFVVTAESGPDSSQNILSTPCCYVHHKRHQKR